MKANEIRRRLQRSALRAGWGEETSYARLEQCRGDEERQDDDFRSGTRAHQKVRAAMQLGGAVRRLTRE